MSVLYRLGALVATSALTVGGLAAIAPPSTAANPPTDAASSWLVQQTKNGLLQSGYEDSSGNFVLYDDQGLTIDAVESLVEAGEQPAAVQSMTDAVEGQAATYANYGSGSVAKLLVLADAAGRNPQTFGGGHLVDQLEGQINANGSMQNAYGAVISEALAGRALTRVGSAKAPLVTSYLLHQQCPDGFFRESYGGSGGSAGDDCVAGVSTGSIDATALTVIEMRNVSDPAVQQALGRARTWLAGQQRADGSFAGVGGVSSANTTGLAARAMGVSPASTRAEDWIQGLQAKSTDGAALSSEVGAIAPDDASFADGRTYGLDERSRTTWTRATAQALAALSIPAPPAAPAPAPATTPALRVRLAHNPVHRRHRDRVVVRGLAPRERAVISYKGHVVRRARANRAGVLRARFGVGKRLGTYAVRSHGFRSQHDGAVWLRVIR